MYHNIDSLSEEEKEALFRALVAHFGKPELRNRVARGIMFAGGKLYGVNSSTTAVCLDAFMAGYSAARDSYGVHPEHCDPNVCPECAKLRAKDLQLRTNADKDRTKAEQCSCGLKEIPVGVNVISWYWQEHSRTKCTAELPNERCWCGLLRSEHTQGHAKEHDTLPYMLVAAPATDKCPFGPKCGTCAELGLRAGGEE